MNPPRRVVIVGASRAGFAVATELRRLGYEGRVTLLGAEQVPPYDRTVLSKGLLRGDVAEDAIGLGTGEQLAGLDLVLDARATGVDLRTRRLEVAREPSLEWDALVIATGAEPRRLPGAHGLAGVHVLRTLEDARGLRAELDGARRLAVVGGGFIGGEVASTAAAMGVDVVLLEADRTLMARALGAGLGERCAQLHRAHGVDVRCAVSVTGLDALAGRVAGVRLSDGTSLAADVVVAGIGVDPAVGWLGGSGLTVDRDGVLADRFLRAGPGVYAAGDVVRWPSRRFGRVMRVEHWNSAHEQGVAVARSLLAASEDRCAYDPVPYVWSDQHGARIQVYGDPAGADAVDVTQQDGEGARVVAVYRRKGEVVGAAGIDAPRELLRYRRLLAEGAVDVAGSRR